MLPGKQRAGDAGKARGDSCSGLDLAGRALATAENALKVAQAIPGASLLTYQHLGHGGADECPEMAARDCDRFFRDTENRLL